MFIFFCIFAVVTSKQSHAALFVRRDESSPNLKYPHADMRRPTGAFTVVLNTNLPGPGQDPRVML